jgi:hypothetical protein
VSEPELPATTPESAPPAAAQVGGLRTKNLVIIGVVTAGVWALAISTGSIIFMSIVGVLTAVLLGFLVWVLRLTRKQQGLASLLQNAASSPEARRAAIARLEAEKDKNDITNVIARAQLESAENPARALELLEPIELKRVPPQLQDDFAILRSQLYLHFGRPRDARPLVDTVNVDNPQRAQMRGLMVTVVAETWARTGKHEEALALIDSVDLAKEDNEQIRVSLLVARAFARFAAGKKGGAREDLRAIADLDVNHLGRFLMPQFKVHPDLQRLAREVAEKNPKVRQMSRQQQAPQRRGRPR